MLFSPWITSPQTRIVWQEHGSVSKSTDDMKINFQKWLNVYEFPFSDLFMMLNLVDAQMDSLKLKNLPLPKGH